MKWPWTINKGKKVEIEDSDNPTEEEVETVDKEIVKIDDRVLKAVEKLKAIDRREKKKAENFKFKYSLKKTPSGRLMFFGDVTLNLDYIADISVRNVGSGYDADRYIGCSSLGSSYKSITVSGAKPARINITYTSGKETNVECSRHVLEQVYAGLIKEWRK